MTGGQLYIVATPIGNIDDITYRAVQVLRDADLIAAEDTRHSRYLLNHYQITTPCVSLHDHNERQRSKEIISRLLSGSQVALISDAGTPLISDPGYHLISEARNAGVIVTPIPGACAAIAALSAGGLPADRFFFEGFLPAKSAARRQRLRELSGQSGTLVFYESTHRIISMLEDLRAELGERTITIARELTKKYETFLKGGIDDILGRMQSDLNQQKGEFVVLVSGKPDHPCEELSAEHHQLLLTLAKELPPKKACAIVSQLSGVSKRIIYNKLLGSDKNSEF